MGDWTELGQAVFLGLVFSFLVAKLISVVISFKESNLKLTRSEQDPQPASKPEPEPEPEISLEETPINTTFDSRNNDRNTSIVGSDSGSDGDSDSWEGIESTELDEEFSAASAFVATRTKSELARVSSEMQLKLYGLYKIATEGPCTAPQPSALNMTARAKWNAWQRLGAMPTEEAMQNYIIIVDELFPSWAGDSSLKKKDNVDASASSSAAQGPMGPVFSSLIEEEEEDSNTNITLDAIHVAAREGARDDLLKQLDSGVLVNLKEGEGRTPLHWAVDRGHLDIVKELLNFHADVNAKDNEGQTPLHYAVLCEREAIAEQLVNHGANSRVIDNEGNSPLDLCDTKWPFMIAE